MSQMLAHSDVEAIRRAIAVEREAWKTYTEARCADEKHVWSLMSSKADRDAAWDAREAANQALALALVALDEVVDQIDIETAR